ncbi:MAG: DUF3459 domain-containing protein [Burkholderiales bacterium]|nr:DUF3459 domain-containing protein [Burkholderiales bacterium]
MTRSNELKRVAGALGAALLSLVAQADSSPDVAPVAQEVHASALKPDWYRKGVFMEIYVRGYQDSNGDGKGDLKGLTQRLDYLQSLGITGLWLMPIFPSADHDHGYAITNYRDIEPDYGTLADFDAFLAAAHAHGMGVILDYVPNHSSAQHPLFKASDADPASPYRDFYVWEADKPAGWQGFHGDPWHAGQHGYYYGVFNGGMPDFNFRNPKVLDFHLDNLKFWLNRGVDGFRIDAAGVLVENSRLEWENQPENHQVLHQFRQLLDRYDNRYMVVEAPSAPAEFTAPESAGSAFAFGLQKQIVASANQGRALPGMLEYLAHYPVANMGTFLANHDSFAGIRLYAAFDGDEPRYKQAITTLLTLPGIPFLYYGEEIGQGGSDPVKYDDQRQRGPMSWDASTGFTTADQPFRPYAGNRANHNVAREKAKPDSLLNTYRTLIHLRTTHPALSVGTLKVLSDKDAPILAFTREAGAEKLLVVINYSAAEHSWTPPAALQHARLKHIYPASGPADDITKTIPLAPFESAVFQIGER